MPEIIVHHLNNSRSQRVLWLLEELELPYSLRRYERDAETLLAPAALSEVHPLGKSPVIEDGQRVVAESGAIVEYLAVRHGNGRLLPEPGSDDYWRWPGRKRAKARSRPGTQARHDPPGLTRSRRGRSDCRRNRRRSR
jgi:glutathione S-transferase